MLKSLLAVFPKADIRKSDYIDNIDNNKTIEESHLKNE